MGKAIIRELPPANERKSEAGKTGGRGKKKHRASCPIFTQDESKRTRNQAAAAAVAVSALPELEDEAKRRMVKGAKGKQKIAYPELGKSRDKAARQQAIADAVGISRQQVNEFLQKMPETEMLPKPAKSAILHESDFEAQIYADVLRTVKLIDWSITLDPYNATSAEERTA